jgi:asparagine synthase (glutamine-hydrolysing)
VSKSEKVALTGDGGDELFRGYSIFQQSLLINVVTTFNFNIPFKILLKIIDLMSDSKDDYIGKTLKLRRAQSITKNRDVNPLFAALGPFGGTELFDLIVKNLDARQRSSRKFISNKFIENYYINEILPKVYLLKSDKMSMAHGLELRAPLLNHKIIECAYEVPELQLIISKRKAKLKKMAERYLPKSILTSRKHGFSTPFHHVVRFIDDPVWLSHQSSDELAEHKRIWAEAKNGNEWAALPAWSLLVKEHFFKKTQN